MSVTWQVKTCPVPSDGGPPHPGEGLLPSRGGGEEGATERPTLPPSPPPTEGAGPGQVETTGTPGGSVSLSLG